MAQTWKVTASAVWIHSSSTASSKRVGSLAKGKTITVDKTGGKNNYYLHFSGGWVCRVDANGKSTMTCTNSNSSKSTTVKSNTKKTTTTTKKGIGTFNNTKFYSSGSYGSKYEQYKAGLSSALRVQNTRAIYGMPYQYMRIVDAKIDGYSYNKDGSINYADTSASFGRQYAQRIVAKLPVLLITPGKPKFMSSYNTADKKSVLEKFITMGSGSILEKKKLTLKSGDGRYYSFSFDYINYYHFVNPMCRSAAFFLGIQNETVDGVKLGNFDWYKNGNIKIRKILPYTGAIAFYIDSDTQISDSFSNSTTDSLLKGTMDSISEKGRELNFILGTAGSQTGYELDKFTDQEKLADNISLLNKHINNLLGSGKGQMLKGMANSLQVLASGGKMVFPEIWSDSSFGRSYSVNIKLATPDCDPLSIYLNILVPVFHLMALVLPRQAGANGYISPFLVRAYYKGLFNCDMGIITDMTITKGEEGCWTKAGLPTSVQVSFTIKDLYDSLFMTSDQNKNLFINLVLHNKNYYYMKNIAMLDYIGNLCGINIQEPDVTRSLTMFYTMNISNKISDAVKLDIFGALSEWWTEQKQDMYNSMFAGLN